MASLLRFHSPRVAQLLDMAAQLRAHERIPAQEQAALQGRQLAQLLRHAARHSPWWRQRMLEAGLDPQKPSPAAWQNLAPLTRQDLQENVEALRARWPQLKPQRIITATSSGSTGAPVRVEKDGATYSLIYAAQSWIECQWHQRDPRLRMAVLAMGAQDTDTDSWGSLYADMGLRGPSATRSITSRTLDEQLDWLLEYRPDYLKCSPRVASELAELTLARGAHLPLRHILSQWERVTPWQRTRCLAAFGAPIIDRYSCEEAGWLALQCPTHQSLHVLAPTVLLEIVDENNRPCRQGETGRVLITPLHAYAMPLLRYELGDLASWGPPCACGMTLPVLSGLLGRTRHRVRLADGTTIPMAFIGDDLGHLPVIREFRVLQYSGGELELQLRTAQPLTPEERASITAILARNGLGSLPARLTEVDHIAWGSGHKREEFVALDQPCPYGPP